MVPAITACGRSFRGAALYYLHDKRQEGEAERLTSERVAWAHIHDNAKFHWICKVAGRIEATSALRHGLLHFIMRWVPKQVYGDLFKLTVGLIRAAGCPHRRNFRAP